MKLTAPFNPNVYDIAQITFRKGDEKEQVFKFPAANHYVNQVEAFSLAATSNGAYCCTLEFSKGTQSMIDMVYEKIESVYKSDLEGKFNYSFLSIRPHTFGGVLVLHYSIRKKEGK